MSKYRCPICGAAHKEQVTNCRLCGQNMSPNAIPAFTQDVKQEIHTDKSIKGVALIGLALVAVIVVGAVVFGVIRADRQIGRAQDIITGSRDDGWASTTNEAAGFTVELPGEVTKESVTSPLTDTGKLDASLAYVPLKSSADTTLLVGSGPVTLPATTSGSTLSSAAAQNFLRDTVIERWLQANEIEAIDVELTETAVAGSPAVTFKTLSPKAQLNGKDAYAQVTFVLTGSKLYVIETISVFKDAEQQDRMLSTFAVNS